MNEELLPCPFCGGSVTFCNVCDGEYQKTKGCCRIYCADCKAEINLPASNYDFNLDRAETLSLWNTRTEPTKGD